MRMYERRITEGRKTEQSYKAGSESSFVRYGPAASDLNKPQTKAQPSFRLERAPVYPSLTSLVWADSHTWAVFRQEETYIYISERCLPEYSVSFTNDVIYFYDSIIRSKSFYLTEKLPDISPHSILILSHYLKRLASPYQCTIFSVCILITRLIAYSFLLRTSIYKWQGKTLEMKCFRQG